MLTLIKKGGKRFYMFCVCGHRVHVHADIFAQCLNCKRDLRFANSVVHPSTALNARILYSAYGEPNYDELDGGQATERVYRCAV